MVLVDVHHPTTPVRTDLTNTSNDSYTIATWHHDVSPLPRRVSPRGYAGKGDILSASPSALLVVGMLATKMVTLGMHSWLPDAMEGPTAVSAVIHAATLVVAGVVWVLRIGGT